MVSALAAAQTTQPDVAIYATVHAKELQFSEVPDVKVTFPNQEKNQTVWHSDRTILPDQVQPHVLYRDIGLRLTITSTLPNIEQIVDEALAPEPQSTTSRRQPQDENRTAHRITRRHSPSRAAAARKSAAATNNNQR